MKTNSGNLAGPREPSHRSAFGFDRSGFTLVELLIVLAIIGLVVGLGVPLFGVLTGAKSVEAGRNVVAAQLGQARTIAVNEGKYAGVMFYVDPATERTAMSIVIVTDPTSNLEDPDPYDKYKTWVPNETYFSGKLDMGQKTPTRGDRAISFAADADTTFRGLLYPATPTASDYLKLFSNYRPTVRSYRCTTSHKAPNNSTPGQRPPQNGPYASNSLPEAKYYARPGGASGTTYSQQMESTIAGFTNNLWGVENQTQVTRYSTGEQTVMPRGVGVQVMITPIVIDSTTNPVKTERYLRTGVIMFDPQGRLVVRDFALDSNDTLGQYLQLTQGTVARQIASGVGLAVYDTTQFKSQPNFSNADVIYQNISTNPRAIAAPTNPAFNDNNMATFLTDEPLEETWLDTNATPLIINRYTGSLSEAQ